LSEARPTGLRDFLLIATGLFGLRVLMGLVTVPPESAFALSLAAAVVFVALPVVATFRGASQPWTPKLAWGLFAGGLALQAVCVLALRPVLPETGVVAVLVSALGQFGLAVWCLGLGAGVAQAVKDKNLLVPMATFLAGFDVYLVFNPTAPTATILSQAPQVFSSVAMSVPAARPATVAPQAAEIVPMAYVGPADLIFVGVFLVCLYRFGMRVRETALWLVPVLVVYLALVLAPIGLTGLPALVPIGATVLAVNAREFKMTGQEKAASWLVALVALALAAYGLFRRATYVPPAAPAETSLPAGVPAPPALEGSPGRAQ
jgi:hypothetical protein